MYSCRLLNKRQCIVRVAYRGRRGRRLSHTLTVPLSVTLAASVNASVRGGPGGRSGCSSGGYRLLWPLTCLSQAGVWPLPTEVRPQLDLLRLRYRLAPVYSVTQYCSRYSILVLLILGGQCPRGSDVARPLQGSARARRRSGPPVALALCGGAALAALTSGPGARQRARPPACTGALPGKIWLSCRLVGLKVLQGAGGDGDEDDRSLHRSSAPYTLRGRPDDFTWALHNNRHQSPQGTETQVCNFCLRFFARIACDEHK